MSKESLVLLFGFIVLIIPFTGFPENWRSYSLGFSGAILIILGYFLRRGAYYRKLDKGNGELSNDSFVESNPTINKESEAVETEEIQSV